MSPSQRAALAVVGATSALAVAPERAEPTQELPEPPTPVGGLLNGLLVTVQDLLPDLLRGAVPTDDLAGVPALSGLA